MTDVERMKWTATAVILAAALVVAPVRPARGEAPTPNAAMKKKQQAEEATAKPAAKELKPGDVLGPDNWQLAKGLLPPEILKHYKKGEYRNPIMAWPDGEYHWAPSFVAATKENAKNLTVNDKETIIDKRTGKQPPYIYGLPFPNIDPKDPHAGVEVLWNYYYAYWNQGNSHNGVVLAWLNPTGLDREAGQDVYFLYYDGQAPRYRIPNPDNLSQQFIATTTYPADLQGTTSLTWRYRDSDKRDSDWVYVPALRRVRAVSPANRSDGFLGSDMSQDDGPFFDGKPEDFTWKLVGQTEMYRLVDPLSLEHKTQEIVLPGGGYRSVWPDRPRIGYEDPNWKGDAWAPIVAALAKRKFWVIEGVPKDQYYLFGKIQLYIDKETYQGAWNRKFTWNGEEVNTLQVMGYLNKEMTNKKGEHDWIWSSSQAYQCAENVKLNRATISGEKLKGKDVAIDRHIPLKPIFFDFSTLQRFGK